MVSWIRQLVLSPSPCLHTDLSPYRRPLGPALHWRWACRESVPIPLGDSATRSPTREGPCEDGQIAMLLYVMLLYVLERGQADQSTTTWLWCSILALNILC